MLNNNGKTIKYYFLNNEFCFKSWIPAFAGMTYNNFFSILLNYKTKKLLSLFLIIFYFIFSIFNFTFTFASESTNEYKKFYITAYYSPLPDQSFYLRGNYEDEKKLNGEGIKGASGKGVYPGMLAAPKSYKFGTKIHFDGLGYGVVDDRGGAIVGSGSRGYDGDRIDIWMGYGEEGLKRALSWGKRVVYGKIISNEEIDGFNPLDLGDFKLSKISIDTLSNSSFVGKNDVNNNVKLVPFSLTKNSSEQDIKKIQEILSKLGFYFGEINGKYDKKIIDAVADFQLNNKIIKSSKDYGAGWYGPKTKEILSKKYSEFLALEKKKEEEKLVLEKEKKLETEKIEKDLASLEQKLLDFTKSIGTPKSNEVGINVRKLQKSLKLLGFFQDKDTAIFGSKTKESLLNYQISRQLVNKAEDPGAGQIGEKTLTKIKEDLKNIVLIDRNKLKEIDI